MLYAILKVGIAVFGIAATGAILNKQTRKALAELEEEGPTFVYCPY